MTTLTDFLLARIAEDEEAAEAGRWSTIPTPHGNFDADRVIAECEAKRRIVERYVDTSYIEATPSNAYDLALFHVMCDLAMPYADHPDYREEWRP